MGLPAPDLILFLDISPEQAKLRGGYWEERYKRETRNAGLGVAWVAGAEYLSKAGVRDAGRDPKTRKRELGHCGRRAGT
ncbi:hypothetical protein K443DRAFT_677321 [Laccaria amethystina LaAM-08-1]|uniref:Uncharacterized protein n=1 Tax=Laccaria amethystina LaAM-08-1 TaxID=1095629 RepID=A0A0C9Y3N7_9AGAR|nr:hypothetical protein K443DRAFT_677321 [Laccaria amethystina LaAM-08-1]